MADTSEEVLNERILRLLQAAMREPYDRDFVPHFERLKTRTYADLPDHTRQWLEGKSAKELKELDSTIEFVVSSRMAGKVLVWVGGAAVALIGYAVATAKFGWDTFAWIRSLPR